MKPRIKLCFVPNVEALKEASAKHINNLYSGALFGSNLQFKIYSNQFTSLEQDAKLQKLNQNI